MKATRWKSDNVKLTADERAIAQKSVGVGFRHFPPAKCRVPRDSLSSHQKVADEWVLHLKKNAALWEKIKTGNVALRFLADERHPMNPDTFEILIVASAAAPHTDDSRAGKG